MNKVEWLAEKCGFTWEGSNNLGTYPTIGGRDRDDWINAGWRYPDGNQDDWLPDLAHSLDVLVKWAFPKIPDMIGFNAEIARPEKSPMLWGVTLNCEHKNGDWYGFSSFEPTLVGACFNTCCEALGWQEPERGN